MAQLQAKTARSRIEARIAKETADRLVAYARDLNRQQAEAQKAGLLRALDRGDTYSAEVIRLRSQLAVLEENYQKSESSGAEESKTKEKQIEVLKAQLAESTKKQLSLFVQVGALKRVVASVPDLDRKSKGTFL